MRELRYWIGSVEDEISEPTEQQLIEIIRKQDGEKFPGLILETTFGFLSISSSQTKRLNIRFDEANKIYPEQRSGILLDKEFKSSERIRFVLDNGQVDLIPAEETVSIETGLDIARYFFNHNSLPKGLQWRGNMEDFG